MISTFGQDGVIGPGFILLPETIKHLDKIYEIIIFKILDIKQRRHNNPWKMGNEKVSPINISAWKSLYFSFVFERYSSGFRILGQEGFFLCLFESSTFKILSSSLPEL